jgi:hypothetical protein
MLFRGKISTDLATKMENIDLRLQQHEKFRNGLNNWAITCIAMIRGDSKNLVKSKHQNMVSLIKEALNILA